MEVDPPTQPGTPRSSAPSGGRKLAGLRVAALAICACLAIGEAGSIVIPEVALRPWLETVSMAVFGIVGTAFGFFGGNTGEWIAQAWAKRGRG